MDEIRFGAVLLAQAGDHIEGYRETGEKVVDIQRPMRGPRGRAVDRGGEITRVSWTTVRTHDSHSQARSFIRHHRADLLANTATEVSFALDGGGTAKLVEAAVEVIEASAYGLQSRITYQVTGAEDIPE